MRVIAAVWMRMAAKYCCCEKLLPRRPGIFPERLAHNAKPAKNVLLSE
jgi:hypothetical protein